MTEKCRWCGDTHKGDHCDLVKAFDLDDDGKITRVEFLTPIDWPQMHQMPEPDPGQTPSYPTLPRKT